MFIELHAYRTRDPILVNVHQIQAVEIGREGVVNLSGIGNNGGTRVQEKYNKVTTLIAQAMLNNGVSIPITGGS